MPMIKLNEVSEPAKLPIIKSRQFYWLFNKIDHSKANTKPACINKWQNTFSIWRRGMVLNIYIGVQNLQMQTSVFPVQAITSNNHL